MPIDVVNLVATASALAAAAIAWWQARVAAKAVRQASRMKLFGAFDLANGATLAHPELLYSVHGLSRDIPEDEARRIAYLSVILDGFQHYYSEEYGGDFDRMTRDLLDSPNFLSRTLAVPENRRRWERMKPIYYSAFDRAFVHAIDRIIHAEQGSPPAPGPAASRPAHDATGS